MGFSILLIKFIIVFLLVPSIIFAETIHVRKYTSVPTIQLGIDSASNGDTVLVWDDIYTGQGNVNISFEGKSIVVKSLFGPTATIIDCGGSPNRAFVFNQGETQATILEGFTIRNGDCSNQYLDFAGGALKIQASPKIKNCIFFHNKAKVGGAIFISKPPESGTSTFVSPIITECYFISDSAVGDIGYLGGAISCGTGAHTTVNKCAFENNYSTYRGGAILTIDITTISECIFLNNVSPQGGAGNIGGIAAIENCTFVNNHAPVSSMGHGGALVFYDSSEIEFNNNIVAFNTAMSNYGGGIWCSPMVSVSFSCNDFWGNTGGDILGNGHDISELDSNTVFKDPIFCDHENNDFHISSYSPCAPSNSRCGTLIGMYDVNCEICCDLAGDINSNDEVNLLDITYAIAYLYRGGPEPLCLDEADANGDCKINILDATYMIKYLYKYGPLPVCGCIL